MRVMAPARDLRFLLREAEERRVELIERGAKLQIDADRLDAAKSDFGLYRTGLRRRQGSDTISERERNRLIRLIGHTVTAEMAIRHALRIIQHTRGEIYDQLTNLDTAMNDLKRTLQANEALP